jgi:hypothetical protein
MTSFPLSDYTPFGYLDNPYHSAVLNPSGVVRSVAPLGFGFFARSMPWAYADPFHGKGMRPSPSYISILQLGLNLEGIPLATDADFQTQGIKIVSRYHTKHMLSYDWEFAGMACSAQYFLSGEHALVCRLTLHNKASYRRELILHASNLYGAPGQRYWGCDGVVSRLSVQSGLGVSKVWAYGYACAVGPTLANGTTEPQPHRRNGWGGSLRST